MGRFTNSLGYTPEEQQRMHQEALDAYDAAARRGEQEERAKHFVGDCSVNGVVSKAIDVYKKSNVDNPLKTGNLVADYMISKVPGVKYWNRGFNLGKLGFVAKQTYDETCKTEEDMF